MMAFKLLELLNNVMYLTSLVRSPKNGDYSSSRFIALVFPSLFAL